MTARRAIGRKASSLGARDHENFSYGEDFSRAEHEFFTSGKKSSRSWGMRRETGRLDGLAWLMGRIPDAGLGFADHLGGPRRAHGPLVVKARHGDDADRKAASRFALLAVIPE
jgi:hypothetical protein